jgi:hypothetical protein
VGKTLAKSLGGLRDETAVGLSAEIGGSEEVGFKQRSPPRSLTLAQSEHEGDDAATDKDDANGGGQELAAFGLHTELRVAQGDAMFLMVGKRNNEREYSQDNQ